MGVVFPDIAGVPTAAPYVEILGFAVARPLLIPGRPPCGDTVPTHQHRAGPAEASTADEAQPSARSLRGLDGINLLMADVRDGVGPYLSVFLKGAEHWDAGEIGVAMAASSVAAAVCQVPAGLLVDGTRAKRLLIAASGLMVGVGCLLIVLFPHSATVVAAQAMLGAASAVNLTAGYVVQWFGYATGFLYLAGIAGVALAFFAALMPETRPSSTGAGASRQAGAVAQGEAA